MATTIDGTGIITVGGTSSTQGRVRLAEDTDNGTNYIELTAPASVTSNRTVTFADADGTVITTADVATQANQEAGSSTTTFVSPGRQQYHPSAAKAWVQFQPNGTIERSYNITSITDNGTGNFTANFTTNFSDAKYAVSVTSKSISDVWGQVYNQTVGQTSSQCQLAYVQGSRSLYDPDTGYAIFFGDQ